MDNTGFGFELNSFKWSCVIGTTGGFELDDQVSISEDVFASTYSRLAQEVYERTGIYVSAAITRSRVVYHEDWGCPKTGEYSFTLSGSCNPAFSEPAEYIAALKELAGRLKKEWKQTTLLMEITPASVIYMRNDDR